MYSSKGCGLAFGSQRLCYCGVLSWRVWLSFLTLRVVNGFSDGSRSREKLRTTSRQGLSYPSCAVFITLPPGVRWLLGVFEAGLFPGVNYYLSWCECSNRVLVLKLNTRSWYKRSELGVRAALFFSAASISGAFGGLLAVRRVCAFSRVAAHLASRKAAISNMDGVGGKPGWAWIFILEGLVTIVIGFLSFWIIQDFPDSAKFLTDAERTVIIDRLQDDDQFSAAGEKLKVKNIWQSLSNWKTYLTSKHDFLFFNLFD